MYLKLFSSVVFCLIALTSVNGKEFLYVHVTNDGYISKISIPEHEVVKEIPTGKYTDYLAKSPDNRILYCNRVNGDLSGSMARNIGVDGEMMAFDTQTDALKWRMDVEHMPHHMSVSKDGKYIYVPFYDTWWVGVIDVEKREVIKKIFIGHGGHGSKLSADGKRLYVGSMMNDNLAVIDTESLRVVNTYHFRDGVRPFAFPKDESVLYVQQSWLHGFVVVDPKTKAQRIENLPTMGKEVPKPRRYPHNVNHGLGLNPAESELWAVGSALNFVAVYSHPDLQLKKTIPVGKDANSIAFSGNGKFAYITNRDENNLSIIDTESYEEIKRLPLGRKPQRMVVIDVPK